MEPWPFHGVQASSSGLLWFPLMESQGEMRGSSRLKSRVYSHGGSGFWIILLSGPRFCAALWRVHTAAVQLMWVHTAALQGRGLDEGIAL